MPGARSVSVSHWEVASDSAVKLITKAIAEPKANSKIGGAEALRRSMLSMINTGKGCEAHPAFWRRLYSSLRTEPDDRQLEFGRTFE